MFRIVAACILALAQRKGLPSMLIYSFAGLLLPPSHLFTGGLSQIAVRLTGLFRYGTILKALGQQIGSLGNWFISLPASLFIYGIIVGRPRNFIPVIGTRAITAIILLQMLGYLSIYLITPHDPAWHLNTSLAGLILQIFTSALFLYFTILNHPETMFCASLE